MAPDKFEKYIREKMRQREITPSAEAWNKIAGQLPEVEEKRKRPFVWYSIAASFVGILIISIYFNQSPKPELDSPVQIVASEKEATDTKTEVNEEPSVIQINENQPLEVLAETTVNEDIEKKLEDKVQEEISPSTEQELAFTETQKSAEEQRIPPGEILEREELLINAKITEVVAEVRLLEMNSEALTEAEVDSLLMKAQSEIMKENIFYSDRTVDAMALLNEVEDELDRSFRDQIFDRLKSGFNKVRTAVADRNN